MIALVISIIVMLILAGVSISAIVGEDGIITKAQGATYTQSRAVLEEYLQEKYVENYDDFDDNNNKAMQLQNIYPEYFYIPAREGIGNLRYVVDSEGHALYLIKKSGLPNEIQKSLTGGDAGEGSYTDYQTLNDVYGVTSDLKVYYSSGIGSELVGISSDNLDNDNPQRTVISADNTISGALSSFDMDGDGNISAEEAKSVQKLTINESSNITSLKDLYNLPALKELILKNVNLSDFEGIQNCSGIYYISMSGCTVGNYSAIGKLGSRLKYLYIYNTTDDEMEKMCQNLATSDLTNLQYMAVSGGSSWYIGRTDMIDGTNNEYQTASNKTARTLTRTDYFSKLSVATQKSIKYLSINNNNITSLSGLSGFENLVYLRCEYNKITTLEDIQNLKNLNWIMANNNALTSVGVFAKDSNLESLAVANNYNLNTLNGLANCTKLKYLYASNCNLGNNLENIAEHSNLDSLKSLENISTLVKLRLHNNSNLIWIDYLKNSTGIVELYLNNNENLSESAVVAIKNTIVQTNKKLPSKYSILLLDSNTTLLNLTDQTLTANQVLALEEYKKITHLSLKNLNITDIPSGQNVNNILNTLLSNYEEMRYLQLTNISGLTDIQFVSNMPKLIELDIANTGVSNLTPLETMKKRTDIKFPLSSLNLGNMNINISTIPKTISGLGWSCYWNSRNNSVNGGIECTNISTWKTLEGNKELTHLHTGDNSWSGEGTVDLTGCSSLKSYTAYYPIGSTLKVPQSLTNIYLWSNVDRLDFSSRPDINDMYIHASDACNQTFINNALKCNSFNQLRIGWGYATVLNLLGPLEAVGIKTLSMGIRSTRDTDLSNFYIPSTCVNFYVNSNDESSGARILNCPASIKSKNGTSLKNFYFNIHGVNPTILNDLEQLENVQLRYADLNTISFANNNKIVTIDLEGNNISNLWEFSKLKECNTINLQGNAIQDTSGNPSNQIFNNLEILKSLNTQNKLRYLYMLNNNGIIDWSPLKSVEWQDKSGF